VGIAHGNHGDIVRKGVPHICRESFADHASFVEEENVADLSGAGVAFIEKKLFAEFFFDEDGVAFFVFFFVSLDFFFGSGVDHAMDGLDVHFAVFCHIAEGLFGASCSLPGGGAESDCLSTIPENQDHQFCGGRFAGSCGSGKEAQSLPVIEPFEAVRDEVALFATRLEVEPIEGGEGFIPLEEKGGSGVGLGLHSSILMARGS